MAGIFLLLAASLGVILLTEPATTFVVLAVMVTVASVGAGIGASTVWFLCALRHLGLRLRFAAPERARRLGRGRRGPRTRRTRGPRHGGRPGRSPA